MNKFVTKTIQRTSGVSRQIGKMIFKPFLFAMMIPMSTTTKMAQLSITALQFFMTQVRGFRYRISRLFIPIATSDSQVMVIKCSTTR